jgi:hypothetical protein
MGRKDLKIKRDTERWRGKWEEEGINKDEGTRWKGTKKEGEGKEKEEEDGAENNDWRNRERGKKYLKEEDGRKTVWIVVRRRKDL